jgi:hypothetical protein
MKTQCDFDLCVKRVLVSRGGMLTISKKLGKLTISTKPGRLEISRKTEGW